MNNVDFWASANTIITQDFTAEGLQKLDYYAEQFINGRLVYQRFSQAEQHGCAAGGSSNVIASILAGAENCTDSGSQEEFEDYQDELQHGTRQAAYIERWAKAVGLWVDDVDIALRKEFGSYIAEGGEAYVYDHGATLVKAIGLDYFIQPVFALDRISLHNAYFPETRMSVLGFGRDSSGEFKIIVEQPFIKGQHVNNEDIDRHFREMGFKLINPRNWTYATPAIYLSDLHDENVIRSISGTLFVVDCDIRINTPSLRAGGNRQLTTLISF